MNTHPAIERYNAIRQSEDESLLRQVQGFVYEMLLASQGDTSDAIKVLTGYLGDYSAGTFPMTNKEVQLVTLSLKRLNAIALH